MDEAASMIRLPVIKPDIIYIYISIYIYTHLYGHMCIHAYIYIFKTTNDSS